MRIIQGNGKEREFLPGQPGHGTAIQVAVLTFKELKDYATTTDEKIIKWLRADFSTRLARDAQIAISDDGSKTDAEELAGADAQVCVDRAPRGWRVAGTSHRSKPLSP